MLMETKCLINVCESTDHYNFPVLESEVKSAIKTLTIRKSLEYEKN